MQSIREWLSCKKQWLRNDAKSIRAKMVENGDMVHGLFQDVLKPGGK